MNRPLDEGFTRIAPPVTERTEGFWRSGANGVLRIARCADCATYMHPPQPVCRRCHGTDIGFATVSGRGVVHSWTINRYQWSPSMPPPYVIAEVELVEQSGLRLLTNIVGCPIDAVSIGLPVEVVFAQSDDVFIPLFRPIAGVNDAPR